MKQFNIVDNYMTGTFKQVQGRNITIENIDGVKFFYTKVDKTFHIYELNSGTKASHSGGHVTLRHAKKTVIERIELNCPDRHELKTKVSDTLKTINNHRANNSDIKYHQTTDNFND